jgi:hypothetical protein
MERRTNARKLPDRRLLKWTNHCQNLTERPGILLRGLHEQRRHITHPYHAEQDFSSPAWSQSGKRLEHVPREVTVL